jgi:hypothetical protein
LACILLFDEILLDFTCNGAKTQSMEMNGTCVDIVVVQLDSWGEWREIETIKLALQSMRCSPKGMTETLVVSDNFVEVRGCFVHSPLLTPACRRLRYATRF